jgi:hypothetical protein
MSQPAFLSARAKRPPLTGALLAQETDRVEALAAKLELEKQRVKALAESGDDPLARSFET